MTKRVRLIARMIAPNCPSEPGLAHLFVPNCASLHLIARLSLVSQELAAHALTGIAAGGCKEKIRELGGIELLVRVLKSNRSEDEPGDTPTGTTTSSRSPPRRQQTIVIGGGKLGGSSQLERVKAHAANALAELARDDAPIQREVVQCGGIDALVAVVTTSKLDSSKARAADPLMTSDDV